MRAAEARRAVVASPCELLYHLNQSGVGLRHFFTLKIDTEVLGTKKEESHNGASTLFWKKGIMGQI